MLRKSVLFVTGVLVTLVGLECMLQLLPVPSATMAGYYIDPAIETYPPNHRFTVATGWDLKNAHHHETNNFGFVDARNFVPDPTAIAVIGDSYVEANMLAEEHRIGPQLEALVNGGPVYSMGVPGTSLLDYAHRARFAHEQWGVQQFVIVVETGDVRQMLCGSGNHARDCVDADTLELRQVTPPQPGLLKRVMRHSAMAQYLFSQLRIQPGKWFKELVSPQARRVKPATVKAAADPVDATKASRLIDRFIASMPSTSHPPVIVINVSHFSGDIQAWNQVHMEMLADKARAAGMQVVALAPVFARWEASSPLSLAVGPYDKHWNATAHRLAAEAVAHRLGK